MNSHLLTNAHIVTPTEDFFGTLEIENGNIVSIIKNKNFSEGINLSGQWLIPGAIDIHSDYFMNKIISTSPKTFPLPSELHFMDAAAAGSGITTLFTVLNFDKETDDENKFKKVIQKAKEINEERGSMLIRHFIQAQMDPYLNPLQNYWSDLSALDSLYLIIFLSNSLEKPTFLSEELIHPYKERFIIGNNKIKTNEEVQNAFFQGFRLCEMPNSREIAKEARKLGQWIGMEAAGYYYGKNGSQNYSCLEAVEEDILDILYSANHFPSLLGSVVKMIESGIEPSKAMNYITLNPAKLLKFDKEIGSIEVGKRADLVVFENKNSFPSVSTIFVNGIAKMHADYSNSVRPLQTELLRRFPLIS